jgi:hypothetical protein
VLFRNFSVTLETIRRTTASVGKSPRNNSTLTTGFSVDLPEFRYADPVGQAQSQKRETALPLALKPRRSHSGQ